MVHSVTFNLSQRVGFLDLETEDCFARNSEELQTIVLALDTAEYIWQN